jgi:hypothetical protein
MQETHYSLLPPAKTVSMQQKYVANDLNYVGNSLPKRGSLIALRGALSGLRICCINGELDSVTYPLDFGAFPRKGFTLADQVHKALPSRFHEASACDRAWKVTHEPG